MFEMKKKKHIKVYVGTDIAFSSPSHPLSMVVQIKRIIDRVLLLPDKEFEYNCNCYDGLDMFYYYGEKKHQDNIKVSFYLNGVSSTYEECIKDLSRGKEFVEQLIDK